MTQIIDELAVTLRDLEIERLNKQARSLIGEIEALRQKNGKLRTQKQAWQARCTKLNQKINQMSNRQIVREIMEERKIGC